MTDTTMYDPSNSGARASMPLDLGGAPRLRWSAIIGGMIAALGIWLLTYAFGLAIGLSSIDPTQPSSARASGLFTGVWSIIAPLIALFVGGLVASRAAPVLTRGVGAMYGLIVWGLTTLVGAWTLVTFVSALVGGAASVGQTAIQTGGAVVGEAMSGAGELPGLVQQAAQSFGLDADQALAPINERLRAEGRPAVTADQLQGALRETMATATREGRLDRETVVNALASQTALDRSDAEAVAERVQTQFQEFQTRAKASMGRARDTLETQTLKAADATGKALWGVFGALAAGLIASIAGALVGASQKVQTWAQEAQIRARSRTPALDQRPLHTSS